MTTKLEQHLLLVLEEVFSPPERSAPAQNALPEPVISVALILSSLSMTSKASQSSSIIVKVNALSFSGRFSFIKATES